IDFGVARQIGGDDNAELGLWGTPGYMAPEQIGRRACPAADVYALGAILYEALTGRVPYPGHSVMDVYRAILAGGLTPPAKLNPRTPPDLEAICLKALAPDKRRRYPTAREFAMDLRRHLDGQPVLASA
ncbi:MAG TPA: protein kinase, partial [Planctomycetota bacterium]|nr:protein kinase [Planctomycetota bacterium]